MQIAVIGLGSMGRRRVRILRQLRPEFRLLGIDTSAGRREQAREEFGIEVAAELQPALEREDLQAVLVCSTPQSHPAIFRELLPRRLHTFSEIDLFLDGYQSLIEAERSCGTRHFLSSTPLYDPEVMHIARCAGESGRVAYRYHVGQYLPDWHPWEDYRNFFASRKRTNGCREILAIEIPWMLEAFGPVASFQIIRNRLTDLEIDFDDNYQMLIRHVGGATGSFHVDVACREPVHHLELYSERCHLVWEGKAGSLRAWNQQAKRLEPVELYGELDRVAGYSEMIIENPYKEELEDFLAGVRDPQHQFRHSYSKNLEALQLIEALESAP